MPLHRRPTPVLAILIALAAACSCDEGGTTQIVPELHIPTPEDGAVTEIDPGEHYRLDFGIVGIGDSVTLPFTVANRGLGALEVERNALDGAQADAFGVAPNRLSVSAATERSFQVTFTPIEEGDAEARLVLGTNDEDFPEIEVILIGRGELRRAEVAPRSLDFGPVVVGTTRTLEVTITSTMESDVLARVREIEPSAARTHFEVSWSSDTADGRILLPAGESRVLEVAFTPGVTGLHDGAFVVEPCETCASVSVQATGTGVDSALLVEPSTIDFGKANPGLTLTRAVTFRNIGVDEITITDGYITGPGGDGAPDLAFAVDDFEAIPVPAGESRELPVHFTPPALSAHIGALRWHATDASSPNGYVSLAGSGGGPTISVVPEVLAFGQAAVGTSTTRVLVVGNVGDDPLEVSEIELTGSDRFSLIDPPETFSLAVGEVTTLTVRYEPDVEGQDEGEIAIHSNDPHSPVTGVPVNALGALLPPCEWSARPPVVNFGFVTREIPVRLAFELTNDGSADCIAGPFTLSSDTDEGFTLPEEERPQVRLGPGEVHRVQVDFQPPRYRTYTGAVDFYISDPTSPQGRVDLAGVSRQSQIVLVPANLDFGEVGTACPFRARSFCAYNVGSTPVTLTDVALEEIGDDEAFTLGALPSGLEGDGALIPPGQQVCFTVYYEPGEEGAHNGAVRLHFESEVTDYDEAFTVGLAGAGREEGGDGLAEGYGCLYGRACETSEFCTPPGTLAPPDELVTVVLRDEDGIAIHDFLTTTDSDGYFMVADVPAGTWNVEVYKGSVVIETEAEIEDGKVTRLPETMCRHRPYSRRVAYIPGSFDSIEVVLERIGVPSSDLDSVSTSILYDLDAMRDYGALFINCGAGSGPATDEDVQQNLRDFVAGGGSLYVSDLAASYVLNTWPEAVPSWSSGGSQNVDGVVEDADLASALGRTDVNIYFNLGGWRVMEGIDTEIPSPPRSVITGDVDYSGGRQELPLMICLPHGGGGVMYTSFHNTAQATDDMDQILDHMVYSLVFWD